MNDRFKFRAWDKINDKWLSNKNCIEIGTGYLTDFYDVEQAFKRRYVLMQCTGLKDKNGKLIYEGDIVEDALMNRFTINFDEKYLSFLLTNIKTKESMVFYPNIKLEVIGNIYENPELLEVE